MLCDPILTHAAAQPHRLAVGHAETGQRWTWAELNAAADRMAAWLAEQLGPASGARVAVLARNHPLQLILQFACARAGAIFVPLNWRLSPSELAIILTDAKPALIFNDPDFSPPEGAWKLHLLETATTLAAASPRPPADARRDWQAPMTLLYTSGTTGRPKGVMISEANAFWGNCNFALGSQVDRDAVFLCDLPMFHTAGLFAAIRAPIWAGGAVWISAGFDPAKTIARIGDPDFGITHYFSVPQMAATLWNHPHFSPDPFAKLKMYITGGAPNPPAQIQRFVQVGIRMSDGFGMSETGSNFGMPVDCLDTIRAKAGSCGLPFLSVEARIVDEQEHDVQLGATGDLLLRGPSVSSGYWNQPDLTKASFINGWFRTGDIARQDEDGFFYIVDRRKDMFISGGENVYPAEIEAVLAELTDIAQCAVVGVKNAQWGEVGRAFIVPRSGAIVTEQAVLDHCRTRLARFKVPAQIRILEGLPQTGSGKILKHMLSKD